MSSKRIVIVGGVAGGASCAARLRRLDEGAEIVVYERGSAVSFANCGLPYYVGGVIEKREKLLMATPEVFRGRFNIDAKIRHEVEKIDPAKRTVDVKDLQTGATSTVSYDALVLAPGAAPVRPPLPGIELPGVFSLRSLDDADGLYERIGRGDVRRAVVVGAGYIGLEMVESLHRRGIHVTVLELLDQITPPMDAEMVQPVQAELGRQGVDLRLGDGAASFEAGRDETITVTSRSGQRYTAELVVLSVGVKPEVGLAREAGLEIGELGGIRVDERMRTSDASIWAVGDAVEVRDWITGAWTLIPLAGPASRQGRIAADVICGRDSRFRGTQGTAVVGLFGMTLATTGASEKKLRSAGVSLVKSYTHSADHAGYYPGAEPMTLKLLFAPDTGRLLGAQGVGKSGVAKRIDVLAMAIQKEATVFDLEEAELCYAPQFGSVRDPVNMAGFVAANVLRGDVDVVHWEEWRQRQAAGERPLVVDVRPPAMAAKQSVPGAVNIPMGKLRGRLDELPRDGEIWVHCKIGQTSYYACRVLAQKGFRVRNLSGGITSYNALPEEA